MRVIPITIPKNIGFSKAGVIWSISFSMNTETGSVTVRSAPIVATTPMRQSVYGIQRKMRLRNAAKVTDRVDIALTEAEEK